MNEKAILPPGQFELDQFPRFGLTPFAYRYPKNIDTISIRVKGDVVSETVLSDQLSELERVDQVSDFHCVTTWSRRNLKWSGYRFRDVFESIIQPQAQPDSEAGFVIIRGQDGYRTSMQLDDLLAADVLLADQLNDAPLSIEHGAPMRLVAPAHYGYKSIKHVEKIEFCCESRELFPFGLRFLIHARGRVALEERSSGAPAWLVRRLYKPFIKPTIHRFRKGMTAFDSGVKRV